MIFSEDELTTGPLDHNGHSPPLTAGDRQETADSGYNTEAVQKVTPAPTATTAHLVLAKEKVKVKKEKGKEKKKVKEKAKEKTKARTEAKIKVTRTPGNPPRHAINSIALVGIKENAPKATAVISNITLLAAFSPPPVVAMLAANASFSTLAKPRLLLLLPSLRLRPLLVDGRVEEDLLARNRIKPSPPPPLYACGS